MHGFSKINSNVYGFSKSAAPYVGVRGFPLRPIPSLGAMGPGPGHLGKFFSARRRRRRRRRRPWAGWLACWLAGWLACWLAGWLAGSLAGWLLDNLS